MAIIFDLDQTIIDSRIAFEMRRNKNWSGVYNLIPQMQPYHEVINLVRELIYLDINVAIVTSSPRSYCNRVLEFLGLTGVPTVCFHDTEKHKPDPEPLLLAIERMNVQEDEPIFVVGDEEKDIVAANQIGAIGILAYWGNPYTYQNWDNRIKPFLFCKDQESLTVFLHSLYLELGVRPLKQRKHNIYQLFDYFPLSRVHDVWSEEIFAEVKNKNDSTAICDIFCRAIERELITPHTYGIFVVPSSTAGRWNDKLLNYVVPRLVESKGFIDCSKHILRHVEHEKQATGGDRSVESNLSTLRLQYALPNMQGAYIIDDITTTGNIFEACQQLLCNAGIKRDNIHCVAIGGTI